MWFRVLVRVPNRVTILAETLLVRFSWVAFATVLVIGAMVGVGAFTFVYAKGASYLGSNPATCANCHIMNEHYSAWIKSSHHTVATCNDCHAPHNIIGKYMTKARNGFWHSFYFTTGHFPDPLRITPRNQKVTEHACRYCHENITQMIDTDGHGAQGAIRCARCHAYVGHWVR